VGYNARHRPERSDVVLSVTGAPVTFQHRETGGVGIAILPVLIAEAYWVPRQHMAGDFPNLGGAIREASTNPTRCRVRSSD
jgi:hypothetical protein